MLSKRDKAPEFSLPSTSGTIVVLKELRGKKVVLYFYPRDDTPGCTREACSFRDNMARLRLAGATVLGVSSDTMASHARFRSKHRLPFDLLVDADNVVARKYGAYGKKLMYGKTVEGTIRSTFLIDEEGRIAAMWSPVKVDGHVGQVFDALVPPAVTEDDSAQKSALPSRSKRKSSSRGPSRKKR